jgi:HAD superfamily hydrolase (TIGR01509 family)
MALVSSHTTKHVAVCVCCCCLLQVTNGKPAPDVFVAAAQQIGVPPAQCLCFEDAPSGVAVSVLLEVVFFVCAVCSCE